jgi:hypothetical protein
VYTLTFFLRYETLSPSLAVRFPLRSHFNDDYDDDDDDDPERERGVPTNKQNGGGKEWEFFSKSS